MERSSVLSQLVIFVFLIGNATAAATTTTTTTKGARKEMRHSGFLYTRNRGRCSSTPGNSGKEIWPELLGVRGEVAEKVINKEHPMVSVGIVEEEMMVTMDFRCDRARIWIDKRGNVKQVPRLG